MAFGFGVGKTVSRKGGSGSFGFGVGKSGKAVKEENVKTHRLPDFLGGGEFKTAGPDTLIKSKREYGGVPTIAGAERHHVVPVSLGGTSDERNIRVLTNAEHDKLSGAGNKAIEDYEAGRIDLPEARLANLTALQRIDDGLDEKSWFEGIADRADFVDSIANFWGRVTKKPQSEKVTFKTSTGGDTITAGKEPVFKGADFSTDKIRAPHLNLGDAWPLKVVNAVYNVPAEQITRLVNAANDVIGDGKFDYGEFKYQPKRMDGASRVSRGTELALSSLNLIPQWLVFSTGLEAAKEIPVVKYPASAIAFGLEKLGQAGGFAAGKALDIAPISDEAKATLRKPVEEIGGLIAMLGTAHKLSKTAAKGGRAEPSVKVASALADTARKTTEAIGEKVAEQQAAGVEITPKVAEKIVSDVVEGVKGNIENRGAGVVTFGNSTREQYLQRLRQVSPEQPEVWYQRQADRQAERRPFVQELYRGGNDLDGTKITDAGVSFSKNRKVAEDFAKERGGGVEEYYLSSEAKIAEYSDFPQGRYKNADPDRILDIMQRSAESERIVEQDFTAAAKWAKQKGFDGIRLPSEGEIRVLNMAAVERVSKPAELPKEPPKTESKVPDYSTEIRQRGLSKGVEEKAVEAKLTEGFRDLPQYETVNMADQARRAAKLLEEDTAGAVEVAMGRKPPPEGLLPESAFVAVENYALKTKNVDLLRQLATQSKLASEATEMGQRIRALGERNEHSAVSAIRRVSELRKKKATERGRDVTDRIQREIKKKQPTVKDWQGFIDSISC